MHNQNDLHTWFYTILGSSEPHKQQEPVIYHVYQPKQNLEGLNWEDFIDIAILLKQHCPRADTANLKDDELKRMVLSLPNFIGQSTYPTNGDLSAILTAWIQLEG
jgi:FeS assembly protein IscX